ncbi:hypothetical protein F4811DRAFT_557552 [Daldinia bambusicola]|nr:hypothetical protein F4811DRAFT_557552 [Daldinia bambusicola]
MLGAPKAAASRCYTNLLVDDFSQFHYHKNSLGLKASDDGSMRTIAASNGSISFTPQNQSYFYEAVPCITVEATGYIAIAFRIRAPPDASITLEMQTAQQDCSSEAFNSTWRYVGNFTGSEQRVVAPMSSWKGVRTTGIVAFNWATWQTGEKKFVWELADVELICGEKHRHHA